MGREIIDRKVERIEGRFGRPVRFFEKGKDNTPSRFQERNEIWEKGFFEKFYPLHAEKK